MDGCVNREEWRKSGIDVMEAWKEDVGKACIVLGKTG